MCPGVLGKVGEPGHLVEILHAIPARKMIQPTERTTAHFGSLVGEIDSRPMVKPLHHLGQAQLVEIAHHIGAGRAPGISRQLTAQGQVAPVIQVVFL